MRVKIECPINFLQVQDINVILDSLGYTLDSKDPECIVVNPGTDIFLDEDYFSRYENLKIVGTPSTGVNHLDVDYLNGRNIAVKCLLDNRNVLEDIHASAEFTWLHIMNAFRRFIPAVNNVDKWREDENESFLRSNELAGKTIGIIGLGRIGRKIAKYAKAFNMNIEYYDPYVDNCQYKRVFSLTNLQKADILCISCYLTEETRGLIGAGILDDFKQGLIVVNTSRGEVVDEEYIYNLIIRDKIFYSCDVLCGEQNINMLRESKLFNLDRDNIVITPHVAGATVESQTKALRGILELCIK
jgi:D-3-phosphoglycerate dehydrogenase